MASSRATDCFLLCSVPCLAVLLFCTAVHGHEHSHDETASRAPSKAFQFRERWDATDVVRDVEHIKEDLAALVDLKKAGELTEEEITFYFFRMHDFDDNKMLDGIEMMAAMRHTIEHGFAPNVQEQSVDGLISLVDGAMMLDTNFDGFISYPELRVTLRRS
uniref:EF-hand domain-containing protein n=1 Tax=Amblyomma maculatum TaxID=34609 RepID=G3MLJ1_AMBMU